MRTVIITVAAFLILCLLMTLNHSYIRTTANELRCLTNTLDFFDKDDCTKTLDELDTLWKESSIVFSLSVSFREIDYLGETLLSMRSSFESENKHEFERYRLLLLDAIDGVARLEDFSIINIL